MGSRLIVFACAGASFGVSPDHYPMTKQFFNGLKPEVKKMQPYSFVTRHIELALGKPAKDMDIEDVLWVLGDLIDATEQVVGEKTILRQFLHQNFVQSVAGTSNINGGDVLVQMTEFKRRCVLLRDAIQDVVYSYYNRNPTDDELNATWIPLLKELMEMSPTSFDIVTTNYDRVIERAIKRISGFDVKTGREEDVDPVINLSLWADGAKVDRSLLTKLHGSVDWQLAGEDADGMPIIRWGHPEKHAPHHLRGIIYPGFKGVPDKEPFKSFHRYFKSIVINATHILFIGFAFRDDHINEILASPSIVPTGARIAVLDPANELPKLPFLKDAKHIPLGFGGGVAGTLTLPPWLAAVKKWATD